jgi:asparagine synthase (glutamine-hydrolysing)
MCGIFGIINGSSPVAIDHEKIKVSAQKMLHRGPDAYGQWGLPNKVELAHLRLAIIDLSPESNQPFFSSCGNFVIVFNGEIFNYIEIKEELLKKGYVFNTSSDTEVLLNAYIEWGQNCVSWFNGDWAFAVYNIREETLFCSRDRFGVKPFNYAVVNGQLIFSSEIKSILSYFPQLRKPNYNVIANYCRNSLGAQIEQTWFEGVNRLLPAHNLIWKQGEIKIEKYWHYPTLTLKDLSFDEAKDTYRKLFVDAVKLRMRSDVPIGTTLSSGLDSSSIVSVLRNFYDGDHKTFTAVFNNDDFKDSENKAYKSSVHINEADLVEKLAEELHLDSHIIPTNTPKFVENLSDIIYHLESGHSSPATIPLSNVLKCANKYVTVVMEGQGADELLSGYVINTFPQLIWEHLKKGNFSQALKEFNKFKRFYSIGYSIKQFIRLLNNDFIERFYHRTSGKEKLFSTKLKSYKRIKDFPLAPPEFSEPINEALFKSHTGGLCNLLHYGDAISMSHSLESRLPFMDVNLIEFCFKLPFDFKMKDGMGKYIHRKSMEGIVPDFILNNPIKFGFNTPLSLNFNSLTTEANQILLSDRCIDRGLFNRNELNDLINKNITNERDDSTILFRFLSVELWFRRFID